MLSYVLGSSLLQRVVKIEWVQNQVVKRKPEQNIQNEIMGALEMLLRQLVIKSFCRRNGKLRNFNDIAIVVLLLYNMADGRLVKTDSTGRQNFISI